MGTMEPSPPASSQPVSSGICRTRGCRTNNLLPPLQLGLSEFQLLAQPIRGTSGKTKGANISMLNKTVVSGSAATDGEG